MGLNDVGCVVANCWQQIPNHFPGVALDYFVVMPNHMHGLLYLPDPIECGIMTIDEWAAVSNYRTGDAFPTDNKHRTGDACVAPTGPKRGSLGAIIGQFKSACTKRIHLIDPDFAWQRNYYERISRSPEETARIQRYILNNPIRWNVDVEYNPLRP
jgi:putative transposase